MRAHYLQHVPFEGLGSIEHSLQQRGYEISATHLYHSEDFPASNDIDMLIIMGGPMSIHDELAYPWLVKEKQFIGDCIARKIPVLGICLGAQLIASCMGAKVYQGKEKEIGWFPIEHVNNNIDTAFCFPKSIEAFHWHGETFDLPKGATLLAKSDSCQHQAFQWGERTIALQFHLETTPESAQAIIHHCGDEIVDATYIQTAETILNASTQQYQSIHALMEKLLDYITRQT